MVKTKIQRKERGGWISRLFRRETNRMNADRERRKAERKALLEGRHKQITSYGINGEPDTYCFPEKTVEIINKCRRNRRWYRLRHGKTCKKVDENFPKDVYPELQICPENYEPPIYIPPPKTIKTKRKSVGEDELEKLNTVQYTTTENQGGTIRRKKRLRSCRKTKRTR
jgi:hypothetical protein